MGHAETGQAAGQGREKTRVMADAVQHGRKLR